MSDEPLAIHIWRDQFDRRELGQLDHAVMYAEHFTHAGIPGHGQFVLIAKLVKLLEEEIARNSANIKDQFPVN